MSRSNQKRTRGIFVIALAILVAGFAMAPFPARASTPPEPVVAIHVSELTQALEAMPAAATTPSGAGTTGYEWWVAEWRYFVGPESLKEALRSDGTPFVEVSDADIASGKLLNPDGSPKYPIVISLAAEAIDTSEIAPLRSYVNAGGVLFAGSSAFTRNPDGTTRGDFAFADEMGVHMSHPTLQNWYANLHFAKNANHRLVADIPSGSLAWRMPLSSDEIPLGTTLSHGIHGYHYVFQISAANDTTVLATGDSGPLLATRPYGRGNFIYHGAMQPIVGHTVYDPSMYAYMIYRRAIEWAFEAANLPIIRLSPLQFDYNGAYVIRHDCENYADTIRAIEASAAFEKAAGGKGDFYFCTGTLREEMADKDAVIASLRRAVSESGATIGSHNGGLQNPVASLPIGAFDHWHWGPDEALDTTPPGYASGKAYAEASLSLSFQDVEGWFAGLDNGRAGCGAAGNCPRIWAAPYMNSTREGSREVLESLSVRSLGTGEQKIGPFPHWALSYQTPGKRFSIITEPTSDWYVGAEIPGAIEWGHTTDTMQAAVDFYYALGAPINLYGHQMSSDSTLMGQFVKYCASKSRMWSTNAVGMADWWRARSTAVVSSASSISGNTVISRATVTGATDPGTAVEVAIPSGSVVSDIQVFLNDVPADPADYRFIGNTIKVRVGASSSSATVQYTITASDNPAPVTTGLAPASATAGGDGFTLTVAGSGFMFGSTVQWNGSNRTTTYVSSTQLTAAITASDIVASGTASVTVSNPAPGGGVSNAQFFAISSVQTETWKQTDWAGGAGQALWADALRYDSATGIDATVPGQISIAGTNTVLFSDDFTRSPDSTDPLSPWIASVGAWSVTDGMLLGSGSAMQYSYASLADAPQWNDYTVQGLIQIPAGSFGGGIGGRVDAATGAHYGAWVYPAGSPGGSNVLKLWKFRSWTDVGSGVPLQQASLPDVGTNWHTLQLTFLGNRIQVSYDGVLQIDVTDANFDSRSPYVSGGISVDWYNWTLPASISVDDISVASLSTYGSSASLASSAFDGGDGVQWQTVSWDAAAGGSTNVCVRTRTADLADQLVSATWSNCYGASGTAFMSENRRWVQYQLGLATNDPWTSPVLNEIRISYLAGPSEGTAPVIINVAPASATAGGQDLVLTVNGSGFVNGSVVRWNGADRPTTFVSATQMTAAIGTSDIAGTGTATVTVFTPAPGGGSSNAQTFTISNPLPTVDHITISPSSASIMAGVSQAFTAQAFDLYNNSLGDVTGTTAFAIGSDGSCTGASCTAIVAGAHTVTANYGGKTVQASLQVDPAALSNFLVKAAGGGDIAPQTAGTPFDIQITARDQYNNTVTSFTDTVQIGSNGALNGSPVTSGAFEAGVLAVQSITISSAQLGTTLSATGPGGANGTSNSFTVNPAGLGNFLIEAATGGNIGPQAAGVPFDIKITARDQYNNTVTGFNGTATLVITSGTGTSGTISPNSVTFLGGVSIPSVAVTEAGALQNITAISDTHQGTSNDFTVSPAGVGNFLITNAAGGSIDPQTAGVPFGIKITARDQYNNIIPDFIGTVALSTDAGSIAPASVTFNGSEGGVLTPNVTLTQSGTNKTITAASDSHRGQSNTFTVNAGALARFKVEAAGGGDIGAQMAGAAFSIQITAQDANNNTAVGFNGTVDISSTGALSTGSGTTAAFTNGVLASHSAAISNAGAFTITATTSGGTEAGVSNSFTVNDPVPTLTGISPASKNYGEADFTLTVNGTGYVNGSVVQWNGSSRMTTYVSSTQVTAAILAADMLSAGTVPVTVFNPAPGGGASNAQTLTINNPAPTASSISPTSRTARTKAITLTVNGSGFNSGSMVRWNGSDRPTIFVTSTQLTAAIPASDFVVAGTATVTVFNPAPGGGTSGGRTITITNPLVPTTTTISPTARTAGGAAFTLTVNGTGFVTDSVVRWNGSDRPTTFVSNAQVTAAIPASDITSAGTAQINVFTPSPGGGASNAQTLTINNPAPTASSISPTSRTARTKAITLTVNGSGFNSGSMVRWNGSDRPTIFVTSTQLTAAIPASDFVVAGTATVTVFNPAPGGGTSGGRTITITNPLVPTTTTISPTARTAGGAAFTLTVNGTGFVTDSVVRWNGSDRPTTFVSNAQVTAAIPASDITSAGTAQINVFTPSPGGGASNAQTLTINNPAPTASSISPTSRTARTKAITLTVNGSGFNSGSMVRWNGSDRPTIFVTSTQLTAAIPASDFVVAGTATVTVFNPAPGGGTSGGRTITITNPLVPTTTTISPTARTAGGAAFTLTVNGTGFVTDSVVRWNGSDRPTTFVSNAQVTAAIPASDITSAGTAQINVFTPSPGGGASNAQTLSVL